jgi:protein TonB
MKNLKKTPKKQLEKFSTIFTQLGLVLVLFVVYLALNYKTEQTAFSLKKHQNSEIVYLEPQQNVIFKKEELVKEKPALKKAQKLILDEISKVDDKTIETFIETPKEKMISLNPDDIIEVKILENDLIIETVPFVDIEFAPIFKGCEGLSKEENKKCFNSKMMQFIQRNFDLERASELGLNSGKYKILSQFIIDNTGNVVDILIKAPHPKLTKEIQKLIDNLPKFTPGKQRGKPVKVKYTLPISFQVE